jgi:hypothetical protein
MWREIEESEHEKGREREECGKDWQLWKVKTT